jgi:hypothetical protein
MEPEEQVRENCQKKFRYFFLKELHAPTYLHKQLRPQFIFTNDHEKDITLTHTLKIYNFKVQPSSVLSIDRPLEWQNTNKLEGMSWVCVL